MHVAPLKWGQIIVIFEIFEEISGERDELLQRITPKLALHFDPNDLRCVNDIQGEIQGASTVVRIIRVYVTAEGATSISGCRVYLTEVETMTESGQYVPERFDHQPLAWSNPSGDTADRFRPEHIMPGVEAIANVVAIDDIQNILILHVPHPFKTRFQGKFPRTGKFRFTLRATSKDGGEPAEVRLLVTWTGGREGLSVDLEP